MTHFLSIMVVLSLLAIADTAHAAKVVALGASNTEGKGRGATPDGVPRDQAYPAQLQRLLASQGCSTTVQNAGVAGDTTAGMLQRLPGAVSADTKVLILQPGGNDARKGQGGNTASNIAAIKAFAQGRGIQVIMLENLGQLAKAHRLADGQHFNAQGHAIFAASLAPRVRSAGGCK